MGEKEPKKKEKEPKKKEKETKKEEKEPKKEEKETKKEEKETKKEDESTSSVSPSGQCKKIRMGGSTYYGTVSEGFTVSEIKKGVNKLVSLFGMVGGFLGPKVGSLVSKCKGDYIADIKEQLPPRCDDKCQPMKQCKSSCKSIKSKCVPASLQSYFPMVKKGGSLRSMLPMIGLTEGSSEVRVIDAWLNKLEKCNTDDLSSSSNCLSSTYTGSACKPGKQVFDETKQEEKEPKKEEKESKEDGEKESKEEEKETKKDEEKESKEEEKDDDAQLGSGVKENDDNGVKTVAPSPPVQEARANKEGATHSDSAVGNCCHMKWGKSSLLVRCLANPKRFHCGASDRKPYLGKTHGKGLLAKIL